MVLTFCRFPFHASCSVFQWPYDTEDIPAFRNSFFIYLKHNLKEQKKKKESLGLCHFSSLCSEKKLERSLPCFSLKHKKTHFL